MQVSPRQSACRQGALRQNVEMQGTLPVTVGLPDALQSKSVPQDERMFAHADGVTTVVTMFKYGRGSVFYLGYDWFQSAVITFYTVLASTGSVATADHDGLHGES